MRLEKFDFSAQFRNGYLNTQANALSRLRTLDETMVSVQVEITCMHLRQYIYKHENFRTDGFDDELEMSSLLLLVTKSDGEPLIASITEEELYLEQGKDRYCQN